MKKKTKFLSPFEKPKKDLSKLLQKFGIVKKEPKFNHTDINPYK